MVIDFIGGNGGGGGTAQYATSAGTANNAKLLDGAGSFPQSANTGDVVAFNGIPDRGGKKGLRDATPEAGVYQYDGSDWNKLGGEGGSSAYKIELSTPNPEDFTETDISNLNYFFDAVEADPSIIEGSYVVVGEDYVYRYEAGSYDSENGSGEFDYVCATHLVIDYLGFMFEDGNYSETYHDTNYFSTLYPNDFPENPVEGMITNYDDGEGNIGLYRYDGEDWVPFGAGGSGSTAYKIELSTSIPDDFTQDDIDALNAFFAAVEENPSIIVGSYICVDKDSIYRYTAGYYDSENAEGEFDFDNATPWGIVQMAVRFESGEMYAEKFYNDFNILKATGEAPADASEGDVYPYHKDAEDYIVGDDWTDTGSDTAEWNSDPDSGNPQAISIQIGKNGSLDFGYSCGDWSDSISFYVNDYEFSAVDDHGNWEEVDGRYILSNSDWLEKTNGAKLYAIFDEATVTLYIFSDDVNEVWPYRVDNTTAEGNIFTGTITPPHGPINKLYQMVYDEDEDALVPTEMAHKTDLNDYFKKEEGTEDQDLWAYNGWNNTWGVQHRNSIIQNGLQETFPYDENDGLVYLGRTEQYSIGWKKIDHTVLEAKDKLPLQSEDGAVYALPSSGYGIVQAQSAHTGQDWFNYEGKTVPTGWTQMRVPYNDTAESQLRHFKTDANGEGQMDLYWHPEDSSNRYWDGLPDGTQQNDGEFNTTDNWGNTIVATKVGNYIVVTFGAGVLNGDEDMWVRRNVEVYTTDSITDYANAVMSKDITRMVKCTQAEYDALVSGGTVDNSTFYVIISPNV